MMCSNVHSHMYNAYMQSKIMNEISILLSNMFYQIYRVDKFTMTSYQTGIIHIQISQQQTSWLYLYILMLPRNNSQKYISFILRELIVEMLTVSTMDEIGFVDLATPAIDVSTSNCEFLLDIGTVVVVVKRFACLRTCMLTAIRDRFRSILVCRCIWCVVFTRCMYCKNDEQTNCLPSKSIECV